MSESRVWLAACLCGPNRHAILATAAECSREAATHTLRDGLKETIGLLLRDRALNPWCGICGSENWHYEVGATPFRTMQEAAPALIVSEAANIAGKIVWGSDGPKPGSA